MGLRDAQPPIRRAPNRNLTRFVCPGWFSGTRFVRPGRVCGTRGSRSDEAAISNRHTVCVSRMVLRDAVCASRPLGTSDLQLSTASLPLSLPPIPKFTRQWFGGRPLRRSSSASTSAGVLCEKSSSDSSPLPSSSASDLGDSDPVGKDAESTCSLFPHLEISTFCVIIFRLTSLVY